MTSPAKRKLRKLRMPDEDVAPVWDKMTPVERLWYEDFKRATEYHNWGALKHVALLAPGSDYVRLNSEIVYEMNYLQRATYTIPTSDFPKYSEWDYSWAAPKRSSNARQSIDSKYQAENTDPEFYSAPGKKVRFK